MSKDIGWKWIIKKQKRKEKKLSLQNTKEKIQRKVNDTEEGIAYLKGFPAHSISSNNHHTFARNNIIFTSYIHLGSDWITFQISLIWKWLQNLKHFHIIQNIKVQRKNSAGTYVCVGLAMLKKIKK